MTHKRLRKIRLHLEALRRNPQGCRATELEAIAKQLGRARENRGKEPTWVRKDAPMLTPALTIPNHGGKDMRPRTVTSVVDQLLADCDEWEQELLAENDDEQD